jgi:hypothetical protein
MDTDLDGWHRAAGVSLTALSLDAASAVTGRGGKVTRTAGGHQSRRRSRRRHRRHRWLSRRTGEAQARPRSE